MDLNELAERATALPRLLEPRIDPDAFRHVRRNIDVGEWDEGLDNLVAILHQAQTPITPEEHQELTELLAALDMPADRLDALNVQG